MSPLQVSLQVQTQNTMTMQDTDAVLLYVSCHCMSHTNWKYGFIL